MTKSSKLHFRNIKNGDWPILSEIYRQGIESGIATLETSTPSWKSWDSSHIKNCRIVAIVDESIAGYGALSQVSKRTVYKGVAEVSIYISSEFKGIGIGTQLLNELIRKSEDIGFWTLQSAIFPENIASIKMHEKTGFIKLGVQDRVGCREGKWYDILLMERRSNTVGVDSK